MKPPVLLIVFNRLDTAIRVLESIRGARPERLYIAADGPRSDKPGEDALCSQVRSRLLDSVDWPCDVRTLFQEKNLGCARGVVTAINWFFESETEGIILEDDCCPLPSFYPFCAELLEHYRNDDRVGLISGNNFQKGNRRGKASYYFSGIANIWGWATWRRVWNEYRLDCQTIYTREEVAQEAFIRWRSRAVAGLFERHYGFVDCENPSTWDYQFLISVLMRHRLQITPNVNLVDNVGFDARATHTTSGPSHVLRFLRTADVVFPLVHTDHVSLDLVADRYYFRRVCLCGVVAFPERFVLKADMLIRRLLGSHFR